MLLTPIIWVRRVLRDDDTMTAKIEEDPSHMKEEENILKEEEDQVLEDNQTKGTYPNPVEGIHSPDASNVNVENARTTKKSSQSLLISQTMKQSKDIFHAKTNVEKAVTIM